MATLLLLLLLLPAPSLSSLFDGVLVTLDRQLLLQSAAHVAARDAALLPAFFSLTTSADEVLRGLAVHGPYSVMNKSVMPPSGNKHDYISLDEYYWPCTCSSTSPLDPPNCTVSLSSPAPGSKPPPRPCDNATGLPYVRHDGFLDPRIADYDFLQFSSLVSDSVTLALAYALSGNESYARGAARVLRTWFVDPATAMRPNLDFAQVVPGVFPTGQHSGLIDANCHLPGVWDAVTLISASPAWTAGDNKTIAQWGRAYNEWLQTSPAGRNESRLEHNNHATWQIVGLASGALWLGDVATAAEVLGDHARAAIVGQQVALNGSLPYELARTRSQFYTDFNLHAMFDAAWMSDLAHVQPGLFAYASPENGTSIRRALDFLVPFAVGGETWPWPEVLPYSYETLYDLFVRAAVVWGNASCA